MAATRDGANLRKDKNLSRKRANPPSRTGADDLLCYADQASFVGLRALGRQPVGHFSWFFPHPIDETAVEQLNARLTQGLLGRRLQRSPLPWGRHRWVTNPVVPPVTWFRDPIPAERLPEWRNSLVKLKVDPEHGPGWRMAVQSIQGGGAALSILISHTIADGTADVQSIADAVAGRRLKLGFLTASPRWTPARLARDGMESLRTLPDVWRALRSLGRLPRLAANSAPGSPSQPQRNSHRALETVVDVPLLQIVMDRKTCEERASELSVKSNILLMAFAARLAFRMNRVDTAGRVKLVMPVSTREPDDRRGNALTAVSFMADPEICRSNPRVLQREFRAEMAAVLRHGDDVSPMLPLIPYVPLWLARRMERLAIGTDLPVGCSLLGELPPELSSLFGQASLVQLSLLERFTPNVLEQLGGKLFLLGYSQGEQILATVAGYAPGRVTTRAEFLPLVRDALADMGLDGSIS